MLRKLRRSATIIFVLAMVLNAFAAVSASSTLSDIEGHWAEETIVEWVEQGYIYGYPDGTFRPGQSITRAEFIRLVNVSMQMSETAQVSFTDVTESDWFYEDVAIAQANGYIQGYEDGTLRPSQPISRQEVAQIVYTVLDPGSSFDTAVLNGYADMESIPPWSEEAIAALSTFNVLRGYPNRTFQPTRSVTRAETVIVLDQALAYEQESKADPLAEVVYDQAGTYGPESGMETLAAHVIISTSDITLKNTIIEGNLTLHEQIGEGNVTLENVAVEGKTIVRGGGENSLSLIDSKLSNLEVNRVDGTVRIIVTGSTQIGSTTLDSGAILESDHVNGFGEIVISAPAHAQVELIGEFGVVTLQTPDVDVILSEGTIATFEAGEGASGSTLHISQGAVVEQFITHVDFAVTGLGRTEAAETNGYEVSFETEPDSSGLPPVSPVYSPLPPPGSGSDPSKAEIELQQQVNADGTIAVQALISATDLYAAELHIGFDATAMEIVGEAESNGNFPLTPGEFFSSLPVAHEADPEAGILTYAGSLLGDRAGHNLEDDVLFSFSYESADGIVPFEWLDEPILITSGGERLQLDTNLLDEGGRND